MKLQIILEIMYGMLNNRIDKKIIKVGHFSRILND